MVVFINGSINSGKTTVSKELCKHIEKVAHIEVDLLRSFIESTSLEQAIPINIENTILVAKNLIQHGYSVVISYILPKATTKKIVAELIELDSEIYYFTLAPKLEIALQDRGGRKLDDWERERIKKHYEKKINNPGFGVVIDNSTQTVAETVLEIVAKIKQRNLCEFND